MKYGEGSHETGANPDFVVTSADRYQRELDRKLKELSVKTDFLTKNINRTKTMAKHTGKGVEIAKEEDVEVIEKTEEESQPVLTKSPASEKPEPQKEEAQGKAQRDEE